MRIVFMMRVLKLERLLKNNEVHEVGYSEVNENKGDEELLGLDSAQPTEFIEVNERSDIQTS